MCTTCGCGDAENTRVSGVEIAPAGHDHPHPHSHPHDHAHEHEHEHEHEHDHGHAASGPQTIVLEQDLLAKNDLLAARNRGWLEGRSIRALNVMSSPGAGKTTLLVRTLQGAGRPAAGRRHRRRPGNVAGCRPHPRARTASHPDQHGGRLPSRCRHAPPRTRCLGPGHGFDGVHRERRSTWSAGALRPAAKPPRW